MQRDEQLVEGGKLQTHHPYDRQEIIDPHEHAYPRFFHACMGHRVFFIGEVLENEVKGQEQCQQSPAQTQYDKKRCEVARLFDEKHRHDHCPPRVPVDMHIDGLLIFDLQRIGTEGVSTFVLPPALAVRRAQRLAGGRMLKETPVPCAEGNRMLIRKSHLALELVLFCLLTHIHFALFIIRWRAEPAPPRASRTAVCRRVFFHVKGWEDPIVGGAHVTRAAF